MLIARAWAADADTMQTETATPDAVPMDAPSAGEAFMMNMGMVLVLVILFYVLLIMPQQRRFKEHRQMLAGLQKGDEVVTGGGLVGKIDSILNDKEMVIDLGNGIKVTALRSTIHTRGAGTGKPANDQKKAAKK